MRFHSKYHKKSHHSTPTVGFPDSATDPIASSTDHFKGDFWLDGVLYADSISLSVPMVSLEVDSLIVNNVIDTLNVGTLGVSSFSPNTDGSNLINVNAQELQGITANNFVLVSTDGAPFGYPQLDESGLIKQSAIPENLILQSLNGYLIQDFLTEFNLSSTVAPLISSDNDFGYEIPSTLIPDEYNHRNYVGFFDYNASNLLSSIPILADTWKIIENDGNGPYTLTSFGPTGISRVWDESTNRFDFSELKIGDMIDIRLDIEVETDVANETIEVDLILAKDTPSEYRVSFIPPSIIKTASTNQFVRYNGIYIGNSDTLTGGGCFEIRTDNTATMKVNGWYCKVTRLTL